MTVAKFKTRPKLIKPPAEGPFHLHLGNANSPGAIKLGPDWDDPDFVVDSKQFPWPVGDSLVDRITALFVLHRLTVAERFAFMDECWRVLKPGGQVLVVVPHYASARAASDPAAQYPPITEAALAQWFSKGWREAEKMDRLYPSVCDFSCGFGYAPAWNLPPGSPPQPVNEYLDGRSNEFIAQALAHEINVVQDIHATLTAIK